MKGIDYSKLNPREQGIIIQNENLLTEAVPAEMLPIDFLRTLKVYKRNFSRSIKMGAC